MAGLVAVWLVLAAGTAFAQSPLVAELGRVAVRYHEDPAMIDRIRDGLELAVRSDPHIVNLVGLARVSFLWGDVRARTSEQKLEAYDRGRTVAERALELEPRNVWARFWRATNTARWGQTKGVIRSLFLIPWLQGEIREIMELDPGFLPVYTLAGYFYAEVPAFAGGSLERSEEMFRKGLARAPRQTGTRLGLAKTLLKQSRVDDARRELQAVIDEPAPDNRADWTTKDRVEAQALLASLRR